MYNRYRFILACVVILFGSAISVGAVTYYVSPAGSDYADGISPETAWASINRGDTITNGSGRIGLLLPGDEVVILAGIYPAEPNGLSLSHCSGAEGKPITYRAQGKVELRTEGNLPAINVDKSVHHLVLDGFELLGDASKAGIKLNGAENITVRDCKAVVSK